LQWGKRKKESKRGENENLRPQHKIIRTRRRGDKSATRADTKPNKPPKRKKTGVSNCRGKNIARQPKGLTKMKALITKLRNEKRSHSEKARDRKGGTLQTTREKKL